MREFFRGWKRKVGVFTLLMACLFAAGWVRNLRSPDAIAFSIHDKVVCQVFSQDGTFKMRLITSEFPVRPPIAVTPTYKTVELTKPYYSSGITRSHAAPVEERMFSPGERSRWNVHGYGFVVGSFKSKIFAVRVFVLALPYLPTVATLTLVSAWLLLSKPRTIRPKPASEP